jgi:UDP-2,3-diacylglucosamine hydrolase
MNEAVFISDLHLHPDQVDILDKFRKFVSWAAQNTRSLYILGDFLHVWPGDDALDAWTEEIVRLVAGLSEQGIPVFFMAGNRDFLIGSTFLHKAKMQRLADPSLIHLGAQPVLLSHGDAYCTQDTSHQWFRRLTRNAWFRYLFLRLPYSIRQSLVGQVRHYSQHNTRKLPVTLQTVPEAMQQDLRRFAANILIHGHTHQPGLRIHQKGSSSWEEYTLSDWDEIPSILCYNESQYQFIKLSEVI